ncbi:MAG: methyl-accepting chemotaxis protein [Pseudomonas sp. PGPPP4]|nr:MAG: methyl-accepting chemotaxis protein [Pseudomonas sp. PGPPP4]
MQDQMDGFAGGKPVQDADFRASQQALSQRIDTAQAMLVEIQRANQTALQGMAQAGDLVVIEAKIEGLQNDLGDLRRRAVEPAKAPPPLIVPKQRSAPATARKPEPPKPVDTPPPFTVVGIEYRGGERFLSVAPPGSTQLSELYLVRPGDNVGGTRWRLANLDDRQAQFSVDGATRTLSVK